VEFRRYGVSGKLKTECVEDYIRYHEKVWPEVISLLKECGYRNYTIFFKGDVLFACFELPVTVSLKEADEKMLESPKVREWQNIMESFSISDDDAVDNSWDVLQEVFHME